METSLARHKSVSSKRRKILGICVAISIAGLGLDKLLLHSGAYGPRAANALAVRPPVTATPAAMDDKVDAIARLSLTPFPADLPDTAADNARDPFALAPAALAILAPPPSETPAEPEQGADAVDANNFDKKHRLSAVVRVDRCWLAIIDGMLLEPGQTLDGCSLVEVDEHSATFQCPHGSARLILENPLASDSAK